MLNQEGYDLMGAAFEVSNVLVFGQIVVELKAVKALAPDHQAQWFNDLRISKKQVGYLINIGSSR